MRRLLWVALLALALGPLFASPEAESASGRLCETRGICHKVAHACSQQVSTQALNVGTSSFTIPANVTLLQRVAAIGAGGGAANGNNDGGGGGGAYSEIDNFPVTPGNSLSLSIGAHGTGGASSTGSTAGTAGGDTSVSYLGSQILLAKGGQPGGGFNGGAGGAAASGVGTVKTNGGAGGAGKSGGPGGGGAGGPHGDGVAGTPGTDVSLGPPYLGGAGGAGDAGFGGAGGAGGNGNAGSNGGNGSPGAEFGQAGSGGGGGGGNGGAPTQSSPGTSGAYGAGGGAPGFGGPTQLAGADGADGVVIVEFTVCGNAPPPPPVNSFFVATTGNDSNTGTLASPFATLGRCQSAMRTSATVKTCTVRAGSYAIGATIALTSADNGETWQFFNGDGATTAVLDGGNAIRAIFDLNNVANVTINGFKIQNTQAYGIADDNANNPAGTGITLKNNEILNIAFPGGGAMQSGGILLDSATNSTIANNYVHDTQGPGITLSAFFASGRVSGSTVTGNVTINNCLGLSDCGAIYTNGRSSGTAMGPSSIKNNYVRDYGGGGIIDAHGIYLDDNASLTTVSGNVVAPKGTTSGANSASPLLIHDGAQNTVSGNIFDLGASATEWTVVWFGDGSSLAGMGGSTFTNNIVVAGFAGTQNTGFSGLSGFSYFQNNGMPASNFTIAHNAYHNYGGGQERTDGPIASDASAVHVTAVNLACSGVTYALAPGSTVFAAPISFPPIVGGFGPPGFTIPASSNHSCP